MCNEIRKGLGRITRITIHGISLSSVFTWLRPSSLWPLLSCSHTAQSCLNTLRWFQLPSATCWLLLTSPGPVPQSSLKLDTRCSITFYSGIKSG